LNRPVSIAGYPLVLKYFKDFLSMANFKKIDDKDFVFVNKPLTEKEEKEFSDFLKNRKPGSKRRTKVSAKRPKRQIAR
jgi:hypothetical protein